MARIMTVSMAFVFDAAHCLPSMPEGHQCRRPHGHTWRAVVALTGPVDPATHMVVDYDEICRVWEAGCKPTLDHRDLNVFFEHPTTETLCVFLHEIFQHAFSDLAVRIDLYEGASACCSYDGRETI